MDRVEGFKRKYSYYKRLRNIETEQNDSMAGRRKEKSVV